MKKLAGLLVCAFAFVTVMANTGCPEPTKPGDEVNQAPKYKPSPRSGGDFQPGGQLGGKKGGDKKKGGGKK